jgi:hypothetical protein
MSVVLNTPLAHDGARYRLALQPWYSEQIIRADLSARTSGRLSNSDLNLLSGSGLLTASSFLQSAPNGLSPGRCMVSERNTAMCDGFIDSGGYQILTGKLRYTEELHFEMLRYAQQFEAGCILDAPTSAIGKHGFETFEDCLTFTRQNGEYTVRNRTPGATRFLNVIQGRSRDETVTWLNAVKSLNDPRRYGGRALEGWAFAGATRTHFSIVLELLVAIRDVGLLRDDARIHFLGLGQPELALILTAIQDALRATSGEAIAVSFDNATPFILAGKFKRALGAPTLTRRGLSVPTHDMPYGLAYVGSDLPWPCSSPFADKLTLGDLNVRGVGARSHWDALSHVMLAAHNVWALSSAIAETNRRFRLARGDALGWLPSKLLELASIVREILRSEEPMKLISRHRALLDSLSHRSRNTTLIDAIAGDDR